MRLLTFFGVVLSMGLSALSDERAKVLSVEAQLLSVELKNEIRAFEDISLATLKVERAITDATDAGSEAALLGKRDRLRERMHRLGEHAKELAARLDSIENRPRASQPIAKIRRNRLKETGRQLDIGIAGPGFYKLHDPIRDTEVFSRYGNFEVNPDGNLVIGFGPNRPILQPAVAVPPEASAVVVLSNGDVKALLPGKTELLFIGQIYLTTFANPDGLKEIDDNFFCESEASGPGTESMPGDDQAGLLRQGFLETSASEDAQALLELMIGFFKKREAGS